MMSSQNYEQSPFSGEQSPPTSGQRVEAPKGGENQKAQSNAPNVIGGEGNQGGGGIGKHLSWLLKDLTKDLKQAGKGFIDSLKEYSKEVDKTRKESSQSFKYFKDDQGRVRDIGGRFAPRGVDPSLVAPEGVTPPPMTPIGSPMHRGRDGYKYGGKPAEVIKRSGVQGLIGRLKGSVGADLQSFLALAPGFARGAEGFGIAEGLGRSASAGELAALQASLLFRGSDFGGLNEKGLGIRSGFGKSGLLEEFTKIGMNRTAAANLLKGVASAAGSTAVGGTLGGFTPNELVKAMASGTDVQGFLSNIGNFQAQLGEDARGDFALEFNRDLGVRGARRTAFQAQRQSGFMSLYSQNIGADRLRYNQLIDAMGGGSLPRGQAIFQRGSGAIGGAIGGLTSDFSGVGNAMLQADAMRRAGGDRLKAIELLEKDKAEGGAAIYTRLRKMGMADRTARLTMAGMGLTTRDIDTLSDVEERAESDTLRDLDKPMIETELSDKDMERALTMSRSFARADNRKMDLGLKNKALIDQKLNADLKISGILIERSKALTGSLDTLINTVKSTVTTIDQINNFTRGEFVDSARAVADPRTSTLDRVYHYSKMGVIMFLNHKAGM